MRVGLIDVDGHNFPNLALMKLSAWHKAQGDLVEWWYGLGQYDRVYMSKVFDSVYTEDVEEPINADEIIKGGTGYDLHSELPQEIEHMMPDYSLYGIEDTAYGFLTRGCPRGCPFCIVAEKEGRHSYKVADLSEWWNGQKNIVLLDPNILGCKGHLELLEQLADSKAYVDFNQGLDARLLTKEDIDVLKRIRTKRIHFAWDLMSQEEAVLKGLRLFAENVPNMKSRKYVVYVLTNFDTTHEQDLYRVEKLTALGFEPYIMIYNKPTAPKITKHLARWVNNRFIFHSCTWDEYIRGKNK